MGRVDVLSRKPSCLNTPHRRRRTEARRRSVPHDRGNISTMARGTSSTRVSVKGSLRTFTPVCARRHWGGLRLLLEVVGIRGALDARVVHGNRPIMNSQRHASVLDVASSLIATGQRLGRPLTVSDDFAEFLTRIPGCYSCRPIHRARRRRSPLRDSASMRTRSIGVNVLAALRRDSRRVRAQTGAVLVPLALGC